MPVPLSFAVTFLLLAAVCVGSDGDPDQGLVPVAVVAGLHTEDFEALASGGVTLGVHPVMLLA
jgi:hypothetical protein